MFTNIVKDLLDKALEERQDLFLIDFKISQDNVIKITIDGDKGVTVEDCIFISRAIEHNLDRDEYDFSLDVMSAGAATTFKLPRQFTKHVGRTLEVKTENGRVEGKLTSASDDGITLEWKARAPKPVGKGKITISKKENIAFKDVLEAKVIIKF